mgnify:CR=1 FL=1
MKKITLTLVLFSISTLTIFAQTIATTKDGKEVLLNDNGSWVYSTTSSQKNEGISVPLKTDTSFNWKDGYGKIVKVQFENYLKGDIDNEVFKKLIMELMVKSEYSLKNKLSFVPIRLTLMGKNNDFSAISVIRGVNSYGAESELKIYYKFDKEGTIKKIN